MIQSSLHQNYCSKNEELCEWYEKRTSNLALPIYSSYDIRDSGYKVTNVDGNIYPAGFNNICPTDKDYSVELFSNYIGKHYGRGIERILLVTEMHTGNPYYWENVLTIKSLLQSSGKKVLIAFPQRLKEPMTVTSSTGVKVDIVSAFEDDPAVKEFNPQLVLSNNDFADALEDWGAQVTKPLNPPRELGWYQRQKSNYFQYYNQAAEEFASIVGVDPFTFNVKTELFPEFELANEGSMKALAAQVDGMTEQLKKEYVKHGIDLPPSIFIKNNAGTYGLGVIKVNSGQDVLTWNYNSRKKMKAAKGGRDIQQVILQEGVPSRVKADEAVAEPVIYMIGSELAGGFLRSHAEKSETESLNSPGAVYKKLCVSDLNVSVEKSPLENVYGWSARLGVLAIGLEGKALGVEFKGYKF